MSDAVAAAQRRLIAGGLHLRLAQFERTGFAAERQHGARSDQLDEIRTMLKEVACPVARLGGIAHLAHAECLRDGHFRRHAGDGAAATGHGDVSAGHHHARPLDFARRDRIAQRHIGQPAIDADIADGRETRLQQHARSAPPSGSSRPPCA
jgi:hypothetical protein